MIEDNLNLSEEVTIDSLKDEFDLLDSMYEERVNFDFTPSDCDLTFRIKINREMKIEEDLITLVKETKTSFLLDPSDESVILVPMLLECRFSSENAIKFNYKLKIPWIKAKEAAKIAEIKEKQAETEQNEAFLFNFIESIAESVADPSKDFILNWVLDVRDEQVLTKKEEGLKRLDLVLNKGENSTKSADSSSLLEERVEQQFELQKRRQEKIELTGKKENKLSGYEQFMNYGGVRGEAILEKKSTFQAHAINVSSDKEVDFYLSLLLTHNKIERATHNMFAYRHSNGCEGCDDDGEDQAGITMLRVLQQMEAKNCLVVCSRWFGGVLLGSDRFKIIKTCTKKIVKENKKLFS